MARVRRKLGIRRTGHAGTLDPLASGLLVVAVGPATRFLQYLPLEPKVYEATFRFGETTTTYDAEGDIIAKSEVPADLVEAVKQNLPRLRGSIEQVPPIYSAIKKDGQPLYAYARRGEEVEIKSRNVFIQEFELIGGEETDLHFRITCSGGTYIRSLAHDLGEAVGCGAHINSLRRTKVGKFSVGEAASIEDCSANDLIPLAEALPPFRLVQVNSGQVDHIQHGRPVKLALSVDEPLVGFLDESGNVVGVGRVKDEWAHPECVIPVGVYEESL